MKTRNIASMVGVAVIALALLFGIMSNVQAAQPVPLAAPTPQSVAGRSTTPSDVLVFSEQAVKTAAGNTAYVNVQDSDVVDLQWVIDQTAVAGAPNTTTLKLQFSNDGVNWVDGSAIATNNSADANDMQQFPVFGKLARVNYTASNSNPFTVTLIAVGK